MAVAWTTTWGPRPDVEGIQYSMLSPEQIRTLSVGEVVSATQNDKTGQVVVTGFQGFPRAGPTKPKISLSDPAMGTTDNSQLCSTCGKTATQCPGHEGHIEFPTAVYNPTKMSLVLNCLRHTCQFCGRVHVAANQQQQQQQQQLLLLPLQAMAVDLPSDPERRMAALWTQPLQTRLRKHGCAFCDMPQGEFSISTVNAVEIVVDFSHADPKLFKSPEEHKYFTSGGSGSCPRPFTASDARAILKMVRADDWALLGFTRLDVAHPADAIQENMIVLPPCVRPAVLAAQGSRRRGIDDLTARYTDVLKAREKVLKLMGDWLTAGLPLPDNFGTPADRAAWLAHIARHTPEAQVTIERYGAILQQLRERGASPLELQAALDQRDDEILERQREAHDRQQEAMRESGEIGRTKSGNQPVQRRRARGPTMTQKEQCARQLAEAVMKLQCQVAGLMIGTFKCPKQYQNQRELNSIRGRMSGKRGRLRENHMGKRTIQSARTVITPDPHLGIHEIGIPRCIATELTTSELVTEHNRALLEKAVLIGANKYYGAESVHLPNGTLIHLSACTMDRSLLLPLPLGAQVNRHLRDGDPIMLNRQPSLHKYSMMCHLVVIYTDPNRHAMGMPPNVTPPYNADFDGDEMNLHVPQNAATRAEAIALSGIPDSMVSQAKGVPLFGAVQNSLLAAHMITSRERFFDRGQVMQLMMALESFYDRRGGDKAKLGPRELDKSSWQLPVPAIVRSPRGPLWTGKQVFSLLLPRGVFLQQTLKFPGGSSDPQPTPAGLDKTFSPEELELLVLDGEILAGVLNKQSVGVGGQLTRAVMNAYKRRQDGSHRACRFVNDIGTLAQAFLPEEGFSVSLRDMVPTPELEAQRHKLNATVKAQLDAMDAKVAVGELEWTTTQREQFLSQLGPKIHSQAVMAVQQSLDARNHLLRMAKYAASKGNVVNLGQMTGAVGPQTVDGKRIRADTWLRNSNGDDPRGYASLYDDLTARGYVTESYVDGLGPHSYQNCGMGSRQSLALLAGQTAPTGYMSRRMTFNMQGQVVRNDGTVRTSNGRIIQFRYGQDGFDPANCERTQLPALATSNKALHADSAEFGPVGERMFNALLKCRDAVRAVRMAVFQWPIDTSALLPSGVKSLVDLVATARPLAGPSAPSAPLESVEMLVNRLVAEVQKELGRVDATVELLLRSLLTPKKLAGQTSEALEALYYQILGRIVSARVAPGESVGVQSAQSVSEPGMQMTMNAFHQSGRHSAASLGFPRMLELMHYSQTPATPLGYVYLRAPYCNSESAAQAAQREIDELLLGTVLTDAAQELSWTTAVASGEFAKSIQLWRAANVGTVPEDSSFYPTVLRCGVRLSVLTQRGRSLLDLVEVVRRHLPAHHGIVVYWSTQPEPAQPVLPALLFRHHQSQKYKAEDPRQLCIELIKHLTKLNETVLVCGVRGVRASQVQQIDVPCILADGALGSRKEWMICTQGAPLTDLLALQDIVNVRRTGTNAVHQAAKAFGVSGAAVVMYHELRRLMQANDAYVTPHSLLLPVDTAHQSGEGRPYNRFGMDDRYHSVLTQAAFEQPISVLSDAATAGKRNGTIGVTEAVFLGQLPPIGTATNFDVVHDPKMPVRPTVRYEGSGRAQALAPVAPVAPSAGGMVESGVWERPSAVFPAGAATVDPSAAFLARVREIQKQLDDRDAAAASADSLPSGPSGPSGPMDVADEPDGSDGPDGPDGPKAKRQRTDGPNINEMRAVLAAEAAAYTATMQASGATTWQVPFVHSRVPSLQDLLQKALGLH